MEVKNQVFNAPVLNVFNSDTITFTAQSTPDDFRKIISEARAKLPVAVGGEAQKAALVELDNAAAAADAEKPNGDVVKSHLDKAAEVLTSATGTADKALGFAQTLVKIGKWAVTLLA